MQKPQNKRISKELSDLLNTERITIGTKLADTDGTLRFTISNINEDSKDPLKSIVTIRERGMDDYDHQRLSLENLISAVHSGQMRPQEIDYSLPNEHLIVVQNKETGFSFLAESKTDGSMEPLKPFKERCGDSLQLNEQFIREHLVANPTYLSDEDKPSILTFSQKDPEVLHTLINQIEAHNDFLSKYGIPDDKTPFKQTTESPELSDLLSGHPSHSPSTTKTDPDANPLYAPTDRDEEFVSSMFEQNPGPDFSKLDYISEINNSINAGIRVTPDHYLNEYTVISSGETAYQIRDFYFDHNNPIENGTSWPGAPTILKFAAVTCPHSDLEISQKELIEKLNSGEYKIDNTHRQHYFSSWEQYDTVQTVMNPMKYPTDQERAMETVLYRKSTGMEFYPQAKEFLLDKFALEHPQETTMVLQLMNDKDPVKSVTNFVSEKHQTLHMSQQETQITQNFEKSNNSIKQ